MTQPTGTLLTLFGGLAAAVPATDAFIGLASAEELAVIVPGALLGAIALSLGAMGYLVIAQVAKRHGANPSSPRRR